LPRMRMGGMGGYGGACAKESYYLEPMRYFW